MNEWNLLELIDTMYFDTTNTNMGKYTGACIKLQDLIKRPLLWVVCWKYIGKVHVGKAFDNLKVEVNVSPDLFVFKWFRENFSKIALWPVPKKLFLAKLSFSHLSRPSSNSAKGIVSGSI